MSIYTTVSREELEAYLLNYNVGTLESFKGIEAGVENTNYFVTTSSGEYVLTLVESVGQEKLPFILGFVDHLACNGLACAQPVHLNGGELFGELNDRPAVLMNRLNGGPLDVPTLTQCETIGKVQAQAHLLASQLPADQYTHLHQWCTETAAPIHAKLNHQQDTLLASALMAAGEIPWTNLPTGPVHADLFPDNALFNHEHIAGLIDFYHACSAPYIYDLCVTLNAWCYDEDSGQYNDDKANALLNAYQSVRPLNEEEQASLNAMQEVAALRFWLSRLRDKLFPKDGEFITVKDPAGKQSLLELLRQRNG
ncbi:MAG: homoserine kinase [Marinobacterium sp.]|nr:homoserine kinase [Marinobacterium sp.]